MRNVAVTGCVVAGAIGLLADSAALRAADAYAVSTIDVPASRLTAACGLDLAGRVVGYYVDARGTHAFLFDHGAFSTLDAPGAVWTAAYGVNSAGQIVGAYGPDEFSGRHGFLWSGGSISSIDVPDGNDTVARGVNNRGQIVGDYLGSDGVRRGFLLSGGHYTTVAFPASGDTSAHGIDDAGQIVGVTGLGHAGDGFLFDGKSYTRIHFPNNAYTEAWGINNLGDVVGQIDGPQAPSRGFERAGSNYGGFDLPGVPSSWDARGLNDLGQIVGAWVGNDGKTHGYVASPAALAIVSYDPATVTLSNSSNVPGPAGNSASLSGPTDPTLDVVSGALRRALTALERAQNQGAYVQQAKGDINSALRDIASAINFSTKHPDAETVRSVASTRPDFAAPARPAPNRNVMLELSLANLEIAFDTLAHATGDDLGGSRSRANNDIAAAAHDLITGITSANRSFLEHH